MGRRKAPKLSTRYESQAGKAYTTTPLDRNEPSVADGARGEVGDGGAGATDGVHSRAVFLTTRPDPTFAMAHLPARPRSNATGVVLCPAFAGEDLFIYRTRRAWAEALAQAGHPALRFDLPGFGDSGGSSLAPGRLAAWKAAVSGASLWLREETGCRRIAALGIGFGGMLAWLAAAEGAPIDDLMLWGVPILGRRMLREVRAAAVLEITRDPELEAAARSVGAPSEEDVLLDASGQLTSKETSEALAEIDLTSIELPAPQRRRVLLFERGGPKPDQQIREYFDSRGAEVTVADGSGYGAMMRYVEFAAVPHTAIERSISWLEGSDSRSEPAVTTAAKPTTQTAVVNAGESVILHADGGLVRERMLTTSVDSIALRGIVTEPVDAPPSGVCAVFFSGGSDRRIGPNRLWVEAARRWAARGVTSVRVDAEGIGDSDGDANDLAPRHYDPRHLPKTVALLDELEGAGLPPRFVLVGFCSGGYRSFQVARSDRRVVGVFAIAFPFFFWSRWTVKVRHSWIRLWERRPTDPPLKATAFWTLRSAWRVCELARRTYIHHFRRRPDKIDRSLHVLRERGVELLLLYRSNSLEYDDLRRDDYMAPIEAMANVRVMRIPGPDVRFRPLAPQRLVSDELDAAIGRVLGGDANTVAAERGPTVEVSRGTGLPESTVPSGLASLPE